MTSQAAVDECGTTPIPQELRDLNARLDYLENLRIEHHVTLRVLAVVTEQLLQRTQSDQVVISDKAQLECGDLEAYRDAESGAVVIRVSR